MKHKLSKFLNTWKPDNRNQQKTTPIFSSPKDIKHKDKTNPKDLIGQHKAPISLIPPVALIKGSWAMQNGADKYGAYNWRDNKVQYMIYLDAILRHTLAVIDGENDAEDSKISHIAHIFANTCILMDAQDQGNLIDNRPKNNKRNLDTGSLEESTFYRMCKNHLEGQ